jgi:hypothetical protein
MNMRKSRLTALSAIAVVTLLSSAAFSYVLLNPPRRWFSTPKNVVVDNGGMASVTDSDNGITAARGAVTAWNGQGGGNVVSSSTGAPNVSLGDGTSHLVFSDPFNICKGTCLAATTVGYYDNSSTGSCGGLDVVEITDSDVFFNLRYDYTTTREPDGCSGEIYLEAVTTHEIGHLIGLGHSSNSAALMYASVAYCNNKTIQSDDQNGLSALYGCNLNTDPPGGGTCDLGQPGDSCTSNGDCCSGNCKGKPGSKTCK